MGSNLARNWPFSTSLSILSVMSGCTTLLIFLIKKTYARPCNLKKYKVMKLMSTKCLLLAKYLEDRYVSSSMKKFHYMDGLASFKVAKINETELLILFPVTGKEKKGGKKFDGR